MQRHERFVRWGGLALLWLLPLPLISACAPSLNVVTARQTAVAGGCWPGAVAQPAPAATTEPPAALYPTCAPALGAPSPTLAPTRTATPIPQATAQPPGGVLQGSTEVGDQPGYASARVLAVNPRRGTAVVGWVSWAANRLDDSRDGQVWVRVQTAHGSWSPLQTVNTHPVKKFFGGLGLAVTRDDTVHAVFGAGGIDGDDRLYLAESSNDGATWSAPTPIGVMGAAPALPTPTATAPPAPGQMPTPNPEGDHFIPLGDVDGGALALRADEAGGLHLLYLTSAGGFHVSYAYRAPGASAWQLAGRLEAGEQYGGQLAVLSLPDGRIRRFVLVKGEDGRRLTLYSSDDGVQWQVRQLETRRFLRSETVVATSVLAVPRGAGLVAVAWSQYAAGGVFAQISLDGGESWGNEEQIAQHQTGGALFDDNGKGLRAGFEPSLVYEAATDQLVAGWVELDLSLRPILARTLLAARPLLGADGWRYAVTPTSEDTPPQLSGWGLRGTLASSADGRYHWLLTLDERNQQYRLEARPLNLAALLDGGAS